MRSTKVKALSLLLALVMVLGLSPGTVWAAEDDVVEIATAEELAAFRDRVNAGEHDLCARLTADIVLTNAWTPFDPASGYVADSYSGTFDGGFYTISGLNVNDSSANGVGLFGTVNGAVIKNLKVDGRVTATNSAFVGGIIGKTAGTVTVENCSFSGSVSSTKTGNNAAAAGIVGRVNAGKVTINNCADLADVSGSCAAGILGYCASANNSVENCYSTGTVSGTVRTGGIGGQVSASTSIKNCYTTTESVCGLNGRLENCYSGSSQPVDASSLSGAFVEDVSNINNGWPILAWQAGAAPVPKDPKIQISGGTSLYMTNSGAQPETTLTIQYVDMDAVPVEWSIQRGGDAVELAAGGDANNSTVVVQAKATGKAAIRAEAADGAYIDELEITVYPFVTTVELEGTAAVGQTVKAKINVLGGEELDYETFPEIAKAVKWRSADGSGGPFTQISGAVGDTYPIPETMRGKYLSFELYYNGEFKTSSAKEIKDKAPVPGPSEPGPPEQSFEEAVSSLGTLYPAYGADTNVIHMVRSALAEKGLEDAEVSIQSITEVYGGADIAQDGGISYFYADPNTTPTIKFGSCRVTFSLSKGGQTLEKEIPIVICWDVDRVKAVMTAEILDKIVLDAEAPITVDLSLPKVIDGKKWALISWQSSDPDTISISGKNQSAADTLFDPYVGVVKRGDVENAVTLTARVEFQLTNSGETPIVLYKTFQVTVPPMSTDQAEAIRQGLLAKLDAGFASKGLTDAATGEQLTPDESSIYTASNDIQFPTTRDFGVDGKYYPVTITTDNEDMLKAPDVNNAARVAVVRPAPGEKDTVGTITVTLHDRDTSVTASKEFKIRVPALTQEEIDAELELMAAVKAAYFDGIKGSNAARDDVRSNLSPFFEVYQNKDGELVWVRNVKDKTGRGIVPVPIEGWEEMEAWRLFRSSNPAVISHENLIVTRQANPKAVTVTSRLSSETLGRYGELYAKDSKTYAAYAQCAGLYYQEVTTDVSSQPVAHMVRAASVSPAGTIVVRGTADPERAEPVVETVDVSFTLRGLDETWIDTVQLTRLDETWSAYDVLNKVLSEYGYTFYRKQGTYVYSIQTPDGTELREKALGENSGWLYKVNGRLPDVYMGACGLHTGDQIIVYYTEDASKDDPNWNWPNHSGGSGSSGSSGPSGPSGTSGPSGATEKPEQTIQVTENKSDNTYTVTLPKDSAGPQRVTIPAGKDGQVVVIVQADGSEKAVKKSLVSDGKTQLLLEKGATVRLADRSSDFSDVRADTWYASAVDFVSSRGIFSGVGGGRFAPGLSLSRGMLATVLFNLEEANAPSNSADLFDDVKDSAWYAESIAWAANQGIVSGYGNGRFGPDDPITREQLAVMLYRYAVSLGMSTGGRDSLTGFSDREQVSPWAAEAMAWAVDSGIISGRGNGTLAPSGTATRAEAAAMICRLVARMVKV